MHMTSIETTSAQHPLLQIDELCVSFKTDEGILKAVEHVSLDVMPGEILGIVGESGCGKSLTCMSVTRLIQGANVLYERGEIRFEGKNTLSLSDRELQSIRGRDISYIFQEPMTALNPLYTIGDQMKELLQIHRIARGKKALDECEAMLEKVKIPNPKEVLTRYPFSLSGGMRQRVVIAMALLTRPKLIIADEPTTALDVTIQAQVLDLLKSLQREMGCAIILITHDLGVISEMCDRVAVMYGGRVCEVGQTDDLFEHPFHPYTQGLVDSRPHGGLDVERLNVIPGSVPSLESKPSGCPFHTRCQFADQRCSVEFPQNVSPQADREVACYRYQ